MLPALGNEFIVLLKETSVAGYIALQDLTKAGDIIRGRTLQRVHAADRGGADLSCDGHDLHWLFVNRLERRLRSSEH